MPFSETSGKLIREFIRDQIRAATDVAGKVSLMQKLNLPEDGSEVQIRKFPWTAKKIYPGITVHPQQESTGNGSCTLDDIGYGVGVTFVQATGDGIEDIERIDLFREHMRGEFSNKKLAVANVFQSTIEYGRWIMPRQYQQHYDISALLVRCWSEEQRK